MDEQRWGQYRRVIDALVDDSLRGQGQVGPRRAMAGHWNENATASFLKDEWKSNQLLSRLTTEDREVVAQMLFESFTSGVHQALVALYEAELEPFADGYSGTPFHDYIGRLNGWEWPEQDGPSLSAGKVDT